MPTALSSHWTKRPVNYKIFILVSLITVIPLGTQMGMTSGMTLRVKEKRLESSSFVSSLKVSVAAVAERTEKKPCPPPDPAVEQRFPGYPQIHTFGKYVSDHGKPFLTQDFWVNIVDSRRTFFLRSKSRGIPPPEKLKEWIQSRPHPISLVINNQQDKSWPTDDVGTNEEARQKLELYMNETNLHAVYAGNVRYLPGYAHKLYPIPLGLKWAWKSSKLFGEPKQGRAEKYKRFGASSPAQTDELFRRTNRTSTVFWRPMAYKSNKKTKNYVRDTPALKAIRFDIPAIVNETAKNSIVFAVKRHMGLEPFFEQLKTHRFVISPPGNGLDTHATWEALLCGCIPIVPRSPLDPVFEDLPVWLVDSWEEITDASVKEKEAYFLQGNKKYKWEKLYQSYWAERIYDGLCAVVD